MDGQERTGTPPDAAGIIPFAFEGQAVRVVEMHGAPWFVLGDVCLVLGIENSGNAAARLDDDEKGVRTMDTLGGPQKAVIINESGLYSLILTSRKEGARRFKKWVTGTVLPSIRKNGGYIAGQERLATGEMTPEELMARALVTANATIAEAKEARRLAEMRATTALHQAHQLQGHLAARDRVIQEQAPKVATLHAIAAPASRARPATMTSPRAPWCRWCACRTASPTPTAGTWPRFSRSGMTT